MTKPVQFILDGRQVVAEAGETIWDVAKREGNTLGGICEVVVTGLALWPLDKKAEPSKVMA